MRGGATAAAVRRRSRRGNGRSGARALMEPAQVQAKGATGNMTLEVGFVYGLNGEVVEFIKRPTPKA